MFARNLYARSFHHFLGIHSYNYVELIQVANTCGGGTHLVSIFHWIQSGVMFDEHWPLKLWIIINNNYFLLFTCLAKFLFYIALESQLIRKNLFHFHLSISSFINWFSDKLHCDLFDCCCILQNPCYFKSIESEGNGYNVCVDRIGPSSCAI